MAFLNRKKNPEYENEEFEIDYDEDFFVDEVYDDEIVDEDEASEEEFNDVDDVEEIESEPEEDTFVKGDIAEEAAEVNTETVDNIPDESLVYQVKEKETLDYEEYEDEDDYEEDFEEDTFVDPKPVRRFGLGNVKTPKAPKVKKVKSKTGNSRIIAGVLALVIAIGVFGVLLNVEKSVLGKDNRTTVYVATKDIKSGTKADSSNFKKASVEKNVVPEDAIADESFFDSKIVKTDIKKNTVIGQADFSDSKTIEGTKIVGLSTDALAGSVNGIVRAGDYVDIYIIGDKVVMHPNQSRSEGENAEEITPETAPTYAKVYVENAFKDDGKLIEPTDKTSIARNINVLVTEEQAGVIINGLAKGKVYIVKN